MIVWLRAGGGGGGCRVMECRRRPRWRRKSVPARRRAQMKADGHGFGSCYIVLFSWQCSTLRVAVQVAQQGSRSRVSGRVYDASEARQQPGASEVSPTCAGCSCFFPCLSVFLSWAVAQVKQCVSESIHSRILRTAALTALSESQLHMSFRAPMFSKMMVALLWPT